MKVYLTQEIKSSARLTKAGSTSTKPSNSGSLGNLRLVLHYTPKGSCHNLYPTSVSMQI